MLIDIVVFDGLDEMDAWGPAEVFRGAAKRGADIGVRLVTRTPQEVVQGPHGLRFVPDGVFEPGAADLLVVPGGGWAAREEQGAWGEVQRGHMLPLLRRAREGTPLLAGVCTGTMLLAYAGLVGPRRASTHHAAWADLEALGATVVRERVVDDGDLITSGGVTSGIDLALWLLEREFSRDLAQAVADRMEYAQPRPNNNQVLCPAPAVRWRSRSIVVENSSSVLGMVGVDQTSQDTRQLRAADAGEGLDVGSVDCDFSAR